MGENIVFHGLALLITLCSIMVVSARNPVTAAVFLVLDLFLLAGIYALQGAHFIAAVQIIVYAGAIVVLFMFVIMLLNLDPSHLGANRKTPFEFLFMGLTTLTFLIIGGLIWFSEPNASVTDTAAPALENTVAVGIRLFSNYLWPFEIASILILLAIIASIVIAKKDHPKAKKA